MIFKLNRKVKKGERSDKMPHISKSKAYLIITVRRIHESLHRSILPDVGLHLWWNVSYQTHLSMKCIRCNLLLKGISLLCNWNTNLINSGRQRVSSHINGINPATKQSGNNQPVSWNWRIIINAWASIPSSMVNFISQVW